MSTPSRTSRGFTLLEVLLVVAAIGILAGIVILAVNPSKQLADTHNAQRRVDVNTILNAVYQYSIDNNGVLPPTILATTTEICVATSSCGGLLELNTALTLGQRYLSAIPYDATASSTGGSGYSIVRSANGRVTVTAMGAENGVPISVTR